jgi:hypothetical protein
MHTASLQVLNGKTVEFSDIDPHTATGFSDGTNLELSTRKRDDGSIEMQSVITECK